MKKTLLASSALVGAALIAAPAHAGTVGSKDAMSVSVGGMLWFGVALADEDISAGRGRGYRFHVNETEVHIAAKNTADNGITYGVNIELNGGAAASDNGGADEAWAFMSSKSWGRLELGDQDDATNRMRVGSNNAHKGLGGPLGGLGGNLSLFGGFGTEGMGARADWDNNTTADATKVTYFTPRFSGFQLGASLTPDTGTNSGTSSILNGNADNDGNDENVVSLGANYVGKFGDAGVTLSAVYQTGTDEVGGSAEINNDIDIFGVGASVKVAGFTIGAHYSDFGETDISVANSANGADQGDAWSVGVGYQAGPMGISAWYTNHEKDNSTTASAAGANSTELTRYGIGAGYTVAPGWLLRADLEMFDHDNATTAQGVGGTTDNDGRGFLLTNMFIF